MDPTSGAETSYPSEQLRSTLYCSILFFCVVFVDQHLSFYHISFGHCIVCYSTIDVRLLITSLVSSDVSH